MTVNKKFNKVGSWRCQPFSLMAAAKLMAPERRNQANTVFLKAAITSGTGLF